MSSHPAYPSRSELHVESRAECLLAEQAKATLTFKRALTVFAEAFDAMHFPLGSPVNGYDTQHISGVIADWMVLRHDFEDAAADLARDAA